MSLNALDSSRDQVVITIVAKIASRDIFETLGSERIGVTNLTFSGSRDIIGHMTI